MKGLSRFEAQELRLHLAGWLPQANVSVLFDRGGYTILVRVSPSKVHEVRSQKEADRLVDLLATTV